MSNFIKPFKLGSGDKALTEINPIQDYILSKGFAIQNSDTLIDIDEESNIQFTDPNSGTIKLSNLIEKSILIRDNLTDLNSIPTEDRYEGLIVYVISEMSNYQLVGGIDNLNWMDINDTGSTTSASGGCVFIYDLIPDVGNINKIMIENNTRILEAASSPDVSQITVYFFAYTGSSNVRPEILVNGNSVSWSTDPNRNPTAYYGSCTLNMNYGNILAEHEDGSSHLVSVSQDSAPTITSCEFINGYPGSQTELKEGDTFDVNVQSDLNFVEIEVDDYGASDGQILTVSSTNNYTFSCNIADRGNTTQLFPIKIRVKKSTGTYSDWFYTNSTGSINGTNVVFLNNLHPSVDTINQSNITYPAGQEAIKDSETVTIHCTCLNYDNITYSSPNGQLSIPNTSTYSENKSGIQRVSGDYNINIANYRVNCNREANDATTTKDAIVYIAHVNAEIQMNHSSYFRSGGNDGTSIQNHTITLQSNQRLIQPPTISDPPSGEGTWQGVFTGGSDNWNRTLQIHDDDTKGSYTWGSLSAINLAGKETTSYTGSNTYTIRGFVSRNITLPAFNNEVNMNVEATNYSNVTLSWSVKSLPNKRAVGTTATPDAGSWCLHTLNTNPTIIRILDTAATDAQSQSSIITIEEII